MVSRSSLCYWYPKIEGKIPTPKTVILPLTEDDLANLWGVLDGKEFPADIKEKSAEIARKVGYPVFLRTDEISGKHEFRDTCFVPSEKEIPRHIINLVEGTAMLMGVGMDALVFRDFLILQSSFLAFNGLPIAKERRYFVEDGKVLCHHPYWPENAIENPGRINWRELLAALNTEDESEIRELTAYAETFSRAMGEGAWSVDFAKTRPGKWMMIDAAEAHRSWHPSDCKIAYGE